MIPLPGSKRKLDFKVILALLAAEALVLSASHHLFNFWGLSWQYQAFLTLVAAPLLAALLWFFLKPLGDLLPKPIQKPAVWLLVPILILAGILAWRSFLPPLATHQLEIRPSASLSAAQNIQVLEIKVPGQQGTVVHFSQLKDLKGWVVKDGVLETSGSTPGPIQVSFFGPVNTPAYLTFLVSPQSAPFTIFLDGQATQVDLARSDPGQSVVSARTRYTRGRLGIDGVVLEAFIACIDFISLVLVMALLFLLQEAGQAYLATRQADKAIARPWPHIGLLVVMLFALLFHILNALSVPLYLGADSTTYLRGAVHLVQFHNLDAIWPYGPGMALLLGPLLALFPRNPWAIKILLHLMAFACIPLAYRLAGQLTKRRGIALLAAVLTALTPDLMLYSNFVMSDLPNVFFELFYCTLLLSAIETFSWPSLLGTLLVGSFAVLLRAENAVLLMIGVLVLLVKALLDLRMQHRLGQLPPSRFLGIPDSLLRLGLATFLAALPILGWCVDNYRLYGFFGLSNDAGVVTYDAWIYYGEASHVHITDQNSPAVKTIAVAYQVYQTYQGAPVGSDPPLGWHIYNALLYAGYSSAQAISIEQQAAMDSLRGNPQEGLEILFIKLREGFQPATQATVTFHLPGEPAQIQPVNSQFFDDDNIPNPALIHLQSSIYQLIEKYYETVYPVWIWVCIAAMFLCFLRRPFFYWLPIVAITAYRLFFPQIFGAAIWRYTISGIVPTQIFALAALEPLFMYGVFVFRSSAGKFKRA